MPNFLGGMNDLLGQFFGGQNQQLGTRGLPYNESSQLTQLISDYISRGQREGSPESVSPSVTTTPQDEQRQLQVPQPQPSATIQEYQPSAQVIPNQQPSARVAPQEQEMNPLMLLALLLSGQY